MSTNNNKKRVKTPPEKVEHLSHFAIKLSPSAHKQVTSKGHTFAQKIFADASPNLHASTSSDVAGGDIKLERLISSVSPERLDEMVKNAQEMDPTYVPVDFNSWYQVKVEPTKLVTPRMTSNGLLSTHENIDQASATVQSLMSTIRRNSNSPASASVESIHLLRPCPPPTTGTRAPPPAAFDPSNDPLFASQGYLDPAPIGIDAKYAWTKPGGDGTSIGFVDCEQGWNFHHEDLDASNISIISGTSTAYFSHGTSVLGVVLMTDNDKGGVGIASKATARVVSQYQLNGYNTANAIISATSAMSPGDVLLLEAQTRDPVTGNGLWPVEIEDATFDAIRLATASGIVVVEAGGNGENDLDNYVNARGEQIFRVGAPGFRDSGAIITGGGSSAAPHSRMYYTNYGSRVDLYAWGENIVTTSTDDAGTDNDEYTYYFNGTSGVSPIISGAAVLLQSISVAKGNSGGGGGPWGGGGRGGPWGPGRGGGGRGGGGPWGGGRGGGGRGGPWGGGRGAPPASTHDEADHDHAASDPHTMKAAGAAPPATKVVYKPKELRDLLKVGATQSANPASDKIGVMPNLKAALASIGM